MVVYDITDIKDSYLFFMSKAEPFYDSYPQYIKDNIDELKLRYETLSDVVKKIKTIFTDVKFSVSDKKIWAVDVNTEIEKIYSIISKKYDVEDKRKFFKCYIPGRTSNITILVKLMKRIREYSLENSYSYISKFKPVLDSLIERGDDFLKIEADEKDSSSKKKVVLAKKYWKNQFKKVKYVIKAEYYENENINWKYFFND